MNDSLFATPATTYLPYEQANPAQHVQALHYLQAQLRLHFPTLAATTWARALAEFRPSLLLIGTQVTLAYQDLTQLAQHLAESPELPVLNPPLYGMSALRLAQYCLHTSELAVRALPELEAVPAGRVPQLCSLIIRLARGHRPAEQVVQAWRWDLVGGPLLPPGLAGISPTPGSPAVEQRLRRLEANHGVTLSPLGCCSHVRQAL